MTNYDQTLSQVREISASLEEIRETKGASNALKLYAVDALVSLDTLALLLYREIELCKSKSA